MFGLVKKALMTYLYCTSDHVFSNQKVSTENRCILKYLYECVYECALVFLFAMMPYIKMDSRFKSPYWLNFSLLILWVYRLLRFSYCAAKNINSPNNDKPYNRSQRMLIIKRILCNLSIPVAWNLFIEI